MGKGMFGWPKVKHRKWHVWLAESEPSKVTLLESDVLAVIWFAKVNMKVILQKWADKVNYN